MKPLVSIIMPAYNAEKWIAESIDSILNQTYENIELLIWNDGSTDGTWRIILSYAQKHKNIVPFYPHKENVGITHALNVMISNSKGKYIARMDADDIAMPDRIERQVEYLTGFLTPVVVGCSVELFGDKNTNERRERWWGNSFSNTYAIMQQLPYRNCICHPSVMFRAETLKKYMYKTSGAFQDYDLFLRMASDGYLIGKIRDTLLKYRVRNDSISAKNESNWAEIKLKLRFLAKKFPRWNKFDTHVMRSIWQIIRRN